MAQTTVRLVGQISGTGWQGIRSLSIRSYSDYYPERSCAVSPYGSFDCAVDIAGPGIYTLVFQKYSYSIVLASEPMVRMSITLTADSQANIQIDDSRENAAYTYVRKLLAGQYRMYSYFAGCGQDSCSRMMLIEQAVYRMHRDSIRAQYPGTYAADVLGSMYDFSTPSSGTELQAYIKNQILHQTHWQDTTLYSNGLIGRMVGLYLDYAADTGAAFRRSLLTFIHTTMPASTARLRLIEEIYQTLTVDIRTERLGWFLMLMVDSPALVAHPVLADKFKRHLLIQSGHQAPEIGLPDTSGRNISLLRTASQHRYTLLLLWSPDCGHCIESMPVLREMYSKYHNQGLEIYAVSMSMDKPLWRKTLSVYKCNWLNVSINEQNKAQPEAYMISFTPTMLLIDSQGRIASGKLSTGELSEVFRKVFSIR